MSLNNLAVLYKEMGDYVRAEPLYKQASSIWRSTRGEQHPNYATSLNNLAALYQKMGDYARAERLFRQSTDIEKSVLGEQHPSYANSLSNLAAECLYSGLGVPTTVIPGNPEPGQLWRIHVTATLGAEDPNNRQRQGFKKLLSLALTIGMLNDALRQDQTEMEPSASKPTRT